MQSSQTAVVASSKNPAHRIPAPLCFVTFHSLTPTPPSWVKSWSHSGHSTTLLLRPSYLCPKSDENSPRLFWVWCNIHSINWQGSNFIYIEKSINLSSFSWKFYRLLHINWNINFKKLLRYSKGIYNLIILVSLWNKSILLIVLSSIFAFLGCSCYLYLLFWPLANWNDKR